MLMILYQGKGSVYNRRYWIILSILVNAIKETELFQILLPSLKQCILTMQIYLYINIDINYDKERRRYWLASSNGQTLLITLDEKVVVSRPLKHLKSINQSVHLSCSIKVVHTSYFYLLRATINFMYVYVTNPLRLFISFMLRLCFHLKFFFLLFYFYEIITPISKSEII